MFSLSWWVSTSTQVRDSVPLFWSDLDYHPRLQRLHSWSSGQSYFPATATCRDHSQLFTTRNLWYAVTLHNVAGRSQWTSSCRDVSSGSKALAPKSGASAWEDSSWSVSNCIRAMLELELGQLVLGVGFGDGEAEREETSSESKQFPT